MADLVEGFNAIPFVTRYHLLGIAIMSFGLRCNFLPSSRLFLTSEALQLGWSPLRLPHVWRLFTNHMWIGKLDFGWLMTMFWVCVVKSRAPAARRPSRAPSSSSASSRSP